MSGKNNGSKKSRSKNKVVQKKLLRAETLEPRMLLSGTNLLQAMLASAPVNTYSASVSAVKVFAAPNQAPTVAAAASAAANPVTGTNVHLSVLGADDGGEPNLKYTWKALSIPPGGLAPTFNINGVNAAKVTTATFKQSGAYIFSVTISDAANLTTTSTVAVSVNQTFTGISVAPATATVYSGAAQQFSATAYDQFGKAMLVQPAVSWSASSGTMTNFGLWVAPNGDGVATITATSGAIQGSRNATVIGPPSVSQAATAAINPIAGKTVSLSVLGASTAGESTLKYSWSTSMYPTGAPLPTFSTSGTNAAKNTVVTFKQAGTYTLTATITDGGNRSVTSDVTVTVNQTFTSIGLTPTTSTVLTNTSQQFTATGLDQFGNAMAVPPAIAWTTTRGVINNTGSFFSAGVAGTATITAASGAIKSVANVTIQNRAPIVSIAPTAAANPVTTASVSLWTLGADDDVENKLKYTWSATTLPVGAVGPSFSTNGTNAAKNTVVTFKQAGTYVLKVTITDAFGLTVTGNITLTVNQTFSGISVTPATPTAYTGTTKQFAATAYDQFGKVMTATPPLSWSVSAGTITSTGLWTVPNVGGTAVITASSGIIQGSTTATVIGAPTITQPVIASANPITGKTVSLSVIGASNAGESTLKYSWAATMWPTNAPLPTFSTSGTNAAKNTVATFKQAGIYTLTATITDGGNRTTTSSITVTVSQTLSSIIVNPATTTILTNTSQTFIATGLDQFGSAMLVQPTVAWTANRGTIAGGLFTAPGVAGSATITASSGSISGMATVTIQNRAPTISVPATSAANPVTASSVQLSILGADDAGEANLKYTWAATTIPTGAVAPTFSANGTNGAKNTLVTFKQAGTYVFKATIADASGSTATSNVTVVVNQTLTGIIVTPTSALVYTGTTKQCTATAYDQFGKAMTVQPTFAWASSAGTITTNGLFTAPATGGTAIVTATSGAIQGTANLTIVGVPGVAQAASASANPVAGKTVALSVLGASSAGESSLKYSWATTTYPVGAAMPTFSANGINAAKNVTVTFKQAGVYTFTATIIDGGNRTTTSSITVTVSQTLTSLGVTPSTASVRTGSTQQFAATGYDQFGNVLAVQPTVTWTTTAGTINANGLFTAPGTTCTATITATCGILKKTASVSVLNSAPTVAAPASATPNPLSGTTAVLSVLGADDAGEGGLKYSWVATSSPLGAPAPTYSLNGNNAAKNTTATFGMAGTYVFTVTIFDAGNLAVTSNVVVVVNQLFAGVSATPSAASMISGTSQQFTATGLDQFGKALTSQPGFSWTTTAGNITSGGLFTAPGATGTAVITARNGSIQTSVSVSYGLLGLQNAGLATLTQTLFVDGSISRADMIQILQSAGADGSVSASEIADFQKILANSATLKIPGYVQSLAADVINYNAANAKYQGQALGNLAAGSTAAQLNKLINKWFFGTDHPTADAQIVYNNNQNWTYRTVAGALFSGSPTHNNEFQGLLGDCYYVTALGTVADQSAAAIQNMFLDNGDGTWTVRFYANGAADYVTVDRMLPTDSSGRLVYADYGSLYTSSANTLWIPLAEKAYAQWNETGKEGRNGTNTYSSLEGGDPAAAYAQILGHSAYSYYLTTQQYLVNAMNLHWAVTMCTKSSTSPSQYGLYGNHAYGVIGYNSAAGTFTLYNPWGTDQPTSALTWAQLQSTCICFQVADTSGSVSFGTTVVNAGVRSFRPNIADTGVLDANGPQSNFVEKVLLTDSRPTMIPAKNSNQIVRDRLFSSNSSEGIDLLTDRTASVNWAGNFAKPKSSADNAVFAVDEFFRAGAMLN